MSVVFFHAHPDDESIFTGGTIARLSDAGVRTVVVLATGSDRDGDDALALVRGREARAACDELGASALHLLGYGDAGSGDADQPFHAVDVDEAAARLAGVLRAEGATGSGTGARTFAATWVPTQTGKYTAKITDTG